MLLEAVLLSSLGQANVAAFHGLYEHKKAWCLVSDWHDGKNANEFLDNKSNSARAPALMQDSSPHSQIPKFVSVRSTV